MPSPTIVTTENLTVGSFKGKFMKFVMPSPTSTAETLTPTSANDQADIGLYFLSQDDYLAKRHSIEECLRGRNDDRVDLWQLRELALSPGGLLEPGLRKRAWPLLTRALDRGAAVGAAADDPSSPSNAAAPPSPTDLAALHRDVQYTVWNVREHFEQQQQLRQQHHSSSTADHKSSNDSTSTGSSTRHVSFAPELLAKHKRDSDEQDSTMPHSVSVDESDTLWSRGSCSLASSRRSSSGRGSRKASKLEQQIVANAVTSCLRTTAPDESEAFEDDRFHYFTGLHDLTALLMVNLESPSLSSLVLGKLATYHLRDAMRKERSILGSALQLTFFPVLQRVDPVLYHHIVVQAGMSVPTFAMKWVSNWFATDVMDIAAASRLLDAFFVSHPAFPMYCAVALLTCHRELLLQCEPSRHAVSAALQALPLLVPPEHNYDETDDLTVASHATTRAGSSLGQVEQVIAEGLRFMNQIPPSSIVAMARKSNERPRLVARIPAIAMFGSSNIPAWFLADTSPNEYAILQRLRSSEEQQQQQQDRAAATAKKEGDDGESSTVVARSAYPLAVAASGRGDRRRRFRWIGSNRRSLVTNVVVGAVALLGLALLLLFRAHPETAAGWMRSTATTPPAPARRHRWLTSIQPWNNNKNVPQDHTTPSWSRRDAGARKPDEDVMKVKPVSQQAAVRVVVVKTTTAAAPKTKEVAPMAVPGLLPSPTRSVAWNWTLEVEEKEQEAAVPAKPRLRLAPLPEQTDLFMGCVQQLAQQLLKNGSKQKKPAFFGRVQQLAQQLLKNGSTVEVEEQEQEAAMPAEPRMLLSPLPEQTDLFVGRVQQLAQQLLKYGSKKKKPAFFGRIQRLAQQLLKNGSKTKTPATATAVPPIIRTALALF